MNKKIEHELFFLSAKIICILAVLIYSMFEMKNNVLFQCLFLFLSATFLLSIVLQEVLVFKRIKVYGLIFQIFLVLIMFLLGFDEVRYYLPFLLADGMIVLRFPVKTVLLLPIVVLICFRWFPGYQFLLLWMESLFYSILYFQEYEYLIKYEKQLKDNNQQEYQLKHAMASEKEFYKHEIKRSRLQFENERLLEKAEITQALHDKLGHAINGSLFQLEACNILIDKQPEESKKILEGVITTLRSSMDEIRIILRREKPKKQELALTTLRSLCEECKTKYNIDADLTIRGEQEAVTEALWEVILDNTYEAVSNALKYAHCTKISIKIIIMYEVIRCVIKDNGVGCKQPIKEGMGIQGMKSRVSAANGSLSIEYINGFEINMILPFHKGV